MKTIFFPRPDDATLSKSARRLAIDLPLTIVADIANDHPGQQLDGARFTHLAAARHTCIRCGSAPAVGRVGLTWLCQKCKEKSE